MKKKSFLALLLAMAIVVTLLPVVHAEEVAKEAPELAALVAEGKLPALEDRIPENPLVVEAETVGKYGGTWRNMIVGGDVTHLARYQGYEQLIRWNAEWSEYVPNIAERWEVNEDSTEYTFYLRKGMKWSDGEPFTAADFDYQVNHVWHNKALFPVYPANYKTGDDPCELVVIDDYTVKFVFKSPNGLFMLYQANMNDVQPFAPAHYLKQYDPEFNENADALAKELGYADAVEYYPNKAGNEWRQNANVPTLNAWIWTMAPDGINVKAEAVRNPYYWKVDVEGRQLPYIDKINYDLVSDTEVAVMKAASGEIDFFDQNIATPGNKSFFYDNMEAGNYHFVTTTMTAPNAMNIILNLNHKDLERRALFSNKDFRIGLSYAINRQEIIDMIYYGDSIPHQTAPLPGADVYDEEFATQYTEYNVDLANEYLDKVLPEKDANGMRLFNGSKLIIHFYIDAARDTFIQATELIGTYWRAVGVDTKFDIVSRDLWENATRGGDGDFDATMHRFGGGIGSPIYTDPRYYLPLNTNSMYALSWAAYYVNPEGTGAKIPPEEPPADVKRAMELYNELKKTGEAEAQRELMKEIISIAKDRFYTIGICTEADSYAICNNDLRNVPDTMPWEWMYPHPAPSNPCCWWFDR